MSDTARNEECDAVVLKKIPTYVGILIDEITFMSDTLAVVSQYRDLHD